MYEGDLAGGHGASDSERLAEMERGLSSHRASAEGRWGLVNFVLNSLRWLRVGHVVSKRMTVSWHSSI